MPIKFWVLALCGLFLGASPIAAEGIKGGVAPAAVASPPLAFGVLAGRWARPDGGYVISIKAVDAGGKLDASYANPAPLPFYKAEASRDGSALKLFFELREGGYNGSSYMLSYDAASDQLKGVYYQAVVRQKFEVFFIRAK